MKIVKSSALIATVFVSGMALAASPHFVGKVAANINRTTGALTVTWKEAGLGANQNVHYTVSATANSTWNCVNAGGNCPQAANKTGPGTLSGTVTLDSGKNGSINGTITLGPPTNTSLTCPGGQTKKLIEVSYSNIQVTDTTNDVASSTVAGPFTATLFRCH